MNTKLILSLNKSVLDEARNYAKSNKTSLSKLIESYLSTLAKKEKQEIEITPLVQSLSGLIDLEDTTDNKEDYTGYLINKYK